MMSLSRVLLALAAGFFAAQAAGSRAEPSAIDPSIGRVEVFAELPNETPYVGETILLKVRSSIHGIVARDQMRQPPLTDFDWQQFGVDAETDEMVNGFRVPVFERTIAVYPRKPGRLTIGPFVRHVTMVTADNKRIETDFASKSLTIEVRAHAGLGHAGDWWLPAKWVRITESWEPNPGHIKLDETARRTITIEAGGVTADRLPPPPPVKAQGVNAFVGPVERETIVTDDGPIARGVYRWDVRPVSMAPAETPAIHIPWFDISARQMRDASAPAQPVAFIGSMGEARRAPAMTQTRSLFSTSLLSTWPLIAGVASFLWTSALGVLIATSQGRRLGARPPFAPARKAISNLRRAALVDNPTAFRSALAVLSHGAPDHWRRIASDPEIRAGLAAVDAHLFGAGEQPVLAPLAWKIVAAWKRRDSAPASASSALLPLDGSRQANRAPPDARESRRL